MRTALIHDYFVTYAGSERVVEQMLDVMPDAEVHGLFDFVPDDERAFLGGRDVTTSFLQHLPLVRRKHRMFFPLYPFAIEQFDLSDYDLVVSSAHGVAKGVITGPDQKHVCMCYSPTRWAWDLQHQYLAESGLERGLRSVFVRWMLHYMRMWELRTVPGVDEFIAISEFVARRIRKTYGRDSHVIYPPVDTNAFQLREDKEDFYVTVSRMVPYKKVGLLVDAFNAMPDKRLVVIGDGPQRDEIEARAGPNVELMGQAPHEVLRDHLERARAFLFAAEEDFGIAPVEAQACGTPVIAYGKGGATETVVDGETGLFFDRQTPESVVETVKAFEGSIDAFEPHRIRKNAERFSNERFRAEFDALLSKVIDGGGAR